MISLSLDRPNVGPFHGGHGNRVAGTGDELYLQSFSVVVTVHDRSNVSGLQTEVTQCAMQHDRIKLLDSQ